MKPISVFEGQIEGSLNGQEIAMTLDDSAEGRAHLMSLMTDLYSDPEMAIIREYSTNALDAHIECLNGQPIEVTTPNALSPYLVIRDYGVGLTVSDLENVYSKYGASNKRGSDEVNGMLGLGGKSALTYTNQFTITAVKGGVKSQVAVTRLESGAGVMEVVDTRGTDEPNGVEIRIPVKRENKITEKVDEFFFFWQPGTVLVNGKEPELLVAKDDTTKINDNVFVISNRSVSRGYNRRYGRDDSTDLIVMGNVAYATKGKPFTAILSDSTYYNQTVVFVAMGTVAFAPSREAIMYGPRTVHAIEAITAQIKAGLVTSITDGLNAAKSHADAFRIWQEWAGIVGPENVPVTSYKGTKFERHIRHRHSFIGIGDGKHNHQTGTRGDTRGSTDTVDLASLLSENTLIVTGYDKSEAPMGPWKRRVAQYVESLPQDVTGVLLFATMPAKPWTDGVASVDWLTSIAPLKLVNAPRVGGGATGTIPIKMRTSSGGWTDTTVVDPTLPCWYMSPADHGDLQYKINQALEITPDAQVVMLGRNRWDKFRRENPTAVVFLKYWTNDYENDVKAKMDEDQLFYAAHDQTWRNEAENLKASKDPTFARLAGIKVDESLVMAYNRIKGPTKELEKTYPLVAATYHGRQSAHKIAYVNAIYTATKGS